jgi:hypothetical protein
VRRLRNSNGGLGDNVVGGCRGPLRITPGDYCQTLPRWPHWLIASVKEASTQSSSGYNDARDKPRWGELVETEIRDFSPAAQSL